MNVFDFDKTIYNGDSTIDFYKYCLRHRPSLIRFLPGQAWACFLYITKRIDREKFKARFYKYIKGVKDIDNVVDDFWNINEHKIKKWYLDMRSDDDIIISASAEFLLAPICKRLSVNLIASDVDKRTGECRGLNCRDKEKVKRFNQIYGDKKIESFYSDSFADTPLAGMAEKSYMVKGNKIENWKF